jgi:hypothetical protein
LRPGVSRLRPTRDRRYDRATFHLTFFLHTGFSETHTTL